MSKEKLNFYFFGEFGEYDCYNPAYVCNKDYAAEILYLIAKHEPFAITNLEISELLNINEEIIIEVIKSLELINAIEVKDDTYRVKFPVFLEEDVIEMENYLNNIGGLIGRKVMEMKDILYKKVSELRCSKSHSYERILYHIICDKILDGTAFEFFTERNTFCTSKEQPGDRDYIIVAYQNSELVENHSNKLLCSSNNYRSSGFTFNSFGDTNGSRKDMFRVLRLVQKSIDNSSPFGEVNEAYNRVLDGVNKELAYECGMLICNVINKNLKYEDLSQKEKNLTKFLKELEYININKNDNNISINIPVFYNFEISTVIREMSDILLLNIFPIVKDIFDNFEVNATNLTPIRHKVDIKETANELWHQIFGATNEYLVKEGFVAVPDNIDGQGRFLRSITVP